MTTCYTSGEVKSPVLSIWPRGRGGLDRRRGTQQLMRRLCLNRNRIGESGSQSRTKPPSPSKVTDVRQLLEEKRQGGSQHRQPPPVATSGKTGELWDHVDPCDRPGRVQLTLPFCRCSPEIGKEALLPRQAALAVPRLPEGYASSQGANQRRAPQTGSGQ